MKVRLVDGFEFEAELNGNNIIPAVEVADDEFKEITGEEFPEGE